MMYVKTVVFVLGLTALLAGVLILRQQRLEEANRLALLHRELQDRRQRLWNEQTRSAQWLTPQQLRQLIDEAGLELLPPVSTRSDDPAETSVRLTSAPGRRRAP